MIRSIRGRVAAHEPEGPVVEVGGVGLLVRVSATTAAGLAPAQAQIPLPRAAASPLRYAASRLNGRSYT